MFFNKLRRNHLGLALGASLLVHGGFFASLPGGAVALRGEAPDTALHITLRSTRSLLHAVASPPQVPRPSAASPAGHAGRPAEAPVRLATVPALFEWFPDLSAAPAPTPAHTDPNQAAFVAQQQQFRAMALLQTRAAIASQLASQLDGAHECLQQADQHIVCNTPTDNALLTQWLDLTLQARRLGLSDSAVELKGASGQLRLQLFSQT